MSATPDMAGANDSNSDSNRAALENVIRKFVVGDYDLRSRVEN